MKRSTFSLLGALVGFAGLLYAPSAALAQSAPPLGVVQQFSVLGNSAVTGSTGTGTVVNGDVGSSPTATITNFPPSTVLAPFTRHDTNDATVIQARTDATAAYNSLAAATCTSDLTGQDLGGMTLGPGVYCFTSTAGLTGNLTLNGTGVFIFKVGSGLTTAVGSTIGGSANPCNVFWQIGTSATLNGNTFMGSVFADASITVASTNTLSGRVIAGTGATGAVTMPGSGGNTIGGCATPAGPPPGPAPTVVTCPTGLTVSGVPGTATVTLSAAAPAGGTVVTLTSSAPGTASVPASVTVPAGLTSVTFNVTPGATPGPVTITASTGSGSTFCSTSVAALGVIPALDWIGLTMLIVLLGVAGVFVMNKFSA